jgi:hypothetical protein
MAVTPRLVTAVAIPVLSFAVGYLLGAAPSSAEGSGAEVLANQRELMRLMRAGSEHSPQEAQATSPRLAGEAKSGNSEPGSSFRLPSLDSWIARIDEAVLRLEAAAERTHRAAPPNPTDTLRRASNPNLPRNDAELKRFIREYESAEQAEYDNEEEYDAIWDAFYNKYRYQPLDAVLDRFGKPDDMQLGAGAATWEYYQETPLGGGMIEDWGVTLEFYDGVLVDFHGWWNRAE